ncbi:MAG: serine protease [Pseudomonadota bacterium]|nr:serine protease [Pseudomonadota bacterium]
MTDDHRGPPGRDQAVSKRQRCPAMATRAIPHPRALDRENGFRHNLGRCAGAALLTLGLLAPPAADVAAAPSQRATPGPAMHLAGTGSGLILDTRGHVLTNAHVVGNCARVQVAKTTRHVPARVEARDKARDLALLRIQAPLPGRPARLRGTKPGRGEPIFVSGYPLHGRLPKGLRLSRGRMGEQESPRGAPSGAVRIEVAIQPGNSGGPVLDPAGNVVGIVTGMLRYRKGGGAVPNHAFALTTPSVRQFLTNKGVDFQRGNATQALAPRALAAQASAMTVLIECLKAP